MLEEEEEISKEEERGTHGHFILSIFYKVSDGSCLFFSCWFFYLDRYVQAQIVCKINPIRILCYIVQLNYSTLFTSAL